MKKLIIFLSVMFAFSSLAIGQTFFSGGSSSSSSSSSGEMPHNHYDPFHRAYDRAQSGIEWQKAWKNNYSKAISRDVWHGFQKEDGLQPLVTGIDYTTRNIYIFNYETDQLITVSQDDILGWHGSLPLQHTAVSADGENIWVSTDATDHEPPRIIRLSVSRLDWEDETVRLSVRSKVEVGAAGEPATLPAISQAPGSTQEIATWIQAAMTQVHGPTFLPFSDFMYWTEYPTDKIHLIKNGKIRSELESTVQIPDWTEQTHGIFFNSSGTLGLGTGYYYDNNIIDVYDTNRVTGELTPKAQIKLEIDVDGEKFIAPFTHLVDWIDERYAYTVTMQHDATSATPTDVDGFVGPSVWLIDAVDMTATKVIDQAMAAAQGGIFRSGSDVAVVNNKLYIAEEDSVRQEDVGDARDGYISVFDITDRLNPVFLKRLEPGVDLPIGYNIAHTLVKTKDNRFVLVFSWHSGWVIKIDTYDDTVSHIWGPDDGLVMPHGGYAAGQIR